MRKGPIESYSVAAILRTAAAESCSGSIVVSATTSGTVFLENGYVYFAVLDGVPPPTEVGRGHRPSKEALRRYVESVLCVLYEIDDGWYQWDPLQVHDDGVRWVFGIESLERAVHLRLDEHSALQRWSAQAVELSATHSRLVRLTPDMWEVVRAMTAPVSAHQLRDRLGWDADRLATSLAELENAHLVPLVERAPAPEPGPETADVGGPWVGTPDLTRRPLVSAVAGRSPEPVGLAPSGVEVAAGTDTERWGGAPVAPRATSTSQTDPRGGPSPLGGTAPMAPGVRPPPPSGGGPSRKSALKRLIKSLRT